MRKRRPRPWWYLGLSSAGPVLWLLATTGFLLLLGRVAIYLLGAAAVVLS